MDIINLIFWFGAIIVILGIFLQAEVKRTGFLCIVVGNTCIAIQGYYLGAYNIILINSIGAIAAAYGFYRWGNHPKLEECPKSDPNG